MKAQGIGGFFMHARGGLLTEYLSEEWFEAVAASVDEAERLGMNAWAYDENGWPSGFCSGRINAMGEKFQQKHLHCRFCATEAEAKTQEHLISIVPHADGFYACHYEINPFYVDTLDRETIAAFLEATHVEYEKRLNDAERRALRGFFTDEPQVCLSGLPWSLTLPNAYRQEYGDDLPPRLPQLFHRIGDDWRETRLRFWRLVAKLFSENYVRQIQEFCNKRGWRLTGHLEGEDTLKSQLAANGAIMPHYEYFDIPGMDLLGRSLGSVVTPLQLFSAAIQTGHKQIVAETFGCGGWAISFADLKWIMQWEMVHGVNLCCQHLEGYSLRGQRKRDYPASLFIHQPWWPWYHHFNDYIARIGLLLSQGEVRYNTLLLHPLSSAFMQYDGAENGCLADYDAAFKEISDALESRQMPHHYGDETLMEKHGSIKDGRLVIGTQSYSLVILPKLCNLSAAQVHLLEKFAAVGGRIEGLRNDFEDGVYVDGRPVDDLLSKVNWHDSIEGLLDAIAPVAELLQICTPDGERLTEINATRRSFADFDGMPAELYYIVNNNRDKGCKAIVKIRAAGVNRYDASTGGCLPVDFIREGEWCVLRHDFPAVGDLLLVARQTPVPAAAPKQPMPPALPLANRWKVVKFSDNLLTIDHCRCEIDGKVAFEDEYILTIQNHLLDLGHSVPIALEYTFKIDDSALLCKPLWLLLEHPEWHRIFVNGIEISNKSDGFFLDPAFERIAIGAAVCVGRNIVRLETTFEQTPEIYESCRKAKIFQTERNKLYFHSEVEAIYIAGQFGVSTSGCWEALPPMPMIPDVAAPSGPSLRYRGDFALVRPPQNVDCGNLVKEGFPFFAGVVTLAQNIVLDAVRPHSICFRGFNGNVLEIKVNGTKIATLLYPDYICAIPEDILREGVNCIEITIVNSLRNMLGHFHSSNGDLLGIGPYSFYKEVEGPFRVVGRSDWDDGWCFVPFGVV